MVHDFEKTIRRIADALAVGPATIALRRDARALLEKIPDLRAICGEEVATAAAAWLFRLGHESPDPYAHSMPETAAALREIAGRLSPGGADASVEPESPPEQQPAAPSASFTRQQAAAYLAVSVRTFDRLLHSSGIPTMRLGPRTIRFRGCDLDTYRARQASGRGASLDAMARVG